MGRKNVRFIRGFPERLRLEVEKSGLSYAELGEKIGCDKKTLYNWRDGACSPDIVSLGKMCTVFGCTADYLMFGKK